MQTRATHLSPYDSRVTTVVMTVIIILLLSFVPLLYGDWFKTRNIIVYFLELDSNTDNNSSARDKKNNIARPKPATVPPYCVFCSSIYLSHCSETAVRDS